MGLVMRFPVFAIVTVGFLIAGAPAFADAIRCSTFLHNRDGSWRSFNEADVEGPDGILHIHEGEVLRPRDRSPQGDIARALDDMCGR